MNLNRIFQPRPALSEDEVRRGLHVMILEGTGSNGYTSITTSGFLAAYALAIGADTLQIGILAALPFITQLVQIPAIAIVEKIRRRKIIALSSWICAQLLWFPMALIPVFMNTPGYLPISLLLVLLGFRGILVAVTNCAWNSWIRDLIPQKILGWFFSRRLIYSTVAAASFGLIAAFFVDYWQARTLPENQIYGFVIVLLFGAVFLAMASPVLMTMIPELQMRPAPSQKPAFWQGISIPLKDKNFRQLMKFLLFWGFALNLAVPFFVVYMLVRLEMSVSLVIGLAVLSQLFNILFLTVWGKLADRYGSKVILSLCASLYMLVILGWTFSTFPDKHSLTLPLLVMLHIFAGIAAAGVNLAVSTIGMKLAPQSQATPYLVGASLATNLGAGLGPIFGGFLANFFAARQMTLDLTWGNPDQLTRLGFFSLTGLDFLFAIAFVVGLFTLNTLAAVHEEGEVDRETVIGELMAHTRATTNGVGMVPLMGLANMFPFGFLRKVPGIDVAIGVTAYQLSETARKITQEASRGRDFSTRVARSLEKGLSQVWKNVEDLPSRTGDMAEDAARGAMRAADGSKDSISLIRPAVVGILKATSNSKAGTEDTVQGIARGIIKGANDMGADLVNAAGETVDSVKDAALRFGLDEKKLTREATRAVLSSVQDLNPEAGNMARIALSRKNLAKSGSDESQRS